MAKGKDTGQTKLDDKWMKTNTTIPFYGCVCVQLCASGMLDVFFVCFWFAHFPGYQHKIKRKCHLCMGED